MGSAIGHIKANPSVVDTFQMLSATADMFAALADLVSCFDADGDLSLPDDMKLRCMNARKALEKAVKPEVYRRWAADQGLP